MARRPRLGILTGGGDCPGLNAVLRAVARAAHFRYPAEVLGIEDGFEGLILPGKVAPLTLERVRGILPKGGTILGASNRANPYAYPDRRGTPRNVSRRVLRRIREIGVEGLIVVGGDGTLHIAHRLAQQGGLNVIGVPKTIDNDLRSTEVSFGFDTALESAMWALDKLHSTAEAHDRVMILEVMGRTTGWIALHAGIAGGADAIIIPEIPYDPEEVAAMIRARARRGQHFSVLVVAEGAMPRGGKPSVVSRDASGFPRFGGAGDRLARQLRNLVPHEVRVVVLGHLQRGGSPSAFDRILGSRLGVAAVELAVAGQYGKMVALRAGRIAPVPIAEVVAGPRRVDPDGDLCRAARALGVSFGERRL
jgi:6-phosphofructokinase 1